jgi:hypothetical protein
VSTQTLDLKDAKRKTRRERAGQTLARTASVQKNGAAALQVSRQRFSKMTRGEYPKLDVAYSLVEKLARYSHTRATPIPVDLGIYAAEVSYQDFDTPALIRELGSKVEAIRQGAETLVEVLGIVALLAERGVTVEES